jgi:hypothetical protein
MEPGVRRKVKENDRKSKISRHIIPVQMEDITLCIENC